MNEFLSFFSDLFSDNPIGLNIMIGGILLVVGVGIVCLIIGVFRCLYSEIGFAKATGQTETGKITNKYYHGENVHTGVGFTTGGQMAMTTSYEDAQYIIEYRSDEDGKKYRIETESDIYDSVERGNKVKAYYKISTTTGDFKWTGEFKKLKRGVKDV